MMDEHSKASHGDQRIRRIIHSNATFRHISPASVYRRLMLTGSY
ncbi:hypothetical protein MRBBS_1116 [Marinobacter sp. BSs20148]|nr:hypothetical protein MRBBS_1116 [Marinobacter sp. BSs20148]